MSSPNYYPVKILRNAVDRKNQRQRRQSTSTVSWSEINEATYTKLNETFSLSRGCRRLRCFLGFQVANVANCQLGLEITATGRLYIGENVFAFLHTWHCLPACEFKPTCCATQSENNCNSQRLYRSAFFLASNSTIASFPGRCLGTRPGNEANSTTDDR